MITLVREPLERKPKRDAAGPGKPAPSAPGRQPEPLALLRTVGNRAAQQILARDDLVKPRWDPAPSPNPLPPPPPPPPGPWEDPRSDLLDEGHFLPDVELQEGDIGPGVQRAQVLLRLWGGDTTPDGWFGPHTKEVVTLFQSSTPRVELTGRVDRETWIELESVWAVDHDWTAMPDANTIMEAVHQGRTELTRRRYLRAQHCFENAKTLADGDDRLDQLDYYMGVTQHFMGKTSTADELYGTVIEGDQPGPYSEWAGEQLEALDEGEKPEWPLPEEDPLDGPD
jgi:hypothetical protein